MADEQNSAPPSAATAKEPKVIKRYTNRKLYDTVESRYVTLDEIAEMVKAGTEVRILDNRTKEDLTSVTLAQIIFEEEKKTSRMSLKVLRDIIRQGGERAQQLIEDARANVEERVGAVRHAAEQKIASVLTKGQATSDRAKELVTTSQEAVQAFQKRVDDRVRAAVDSMTALPQLQKELAQLNARLDALEKRLSDLEP